MKEPQGGVAGVSVTLDEIARQDAQREFQRVTRKRSGKRNRRFAPVTINGKTWSQR